MAGVKALGLALAGTVGVYSSRGAARAFMMNLPSVWDVLSVGLQERTLVAWEHARSKIRLVSSRIAICRPQDRRPLLLMDEEKAGMAVPLTSCSPTLLRHRSIPRCHPQLALSVCPSTSEVLVAPERSQWGRGGFGVGLESGRNWGPGEGELVFKDEGKASELCSPGGPPQADREVCLLPWPSPLPVSGVLLSLDKGS